MARMKDKGKKEGNLHVENIPVEETLLIRQRLRNICELAVAIGRKNGLIGNYENNETMDSKGGQDDSEDTDTQVRGDNQTAPPAGSHPDEKRRSLSSPGTRQS